MPRNPSAVGLLIRQRREKMRLSRAALARKAHLSQSTVKNAESGRHQPTRATLAELAVALEMPELVGPQSAVVTTGLVEALRLAKINLWTLFSDGAQLALSLGKGRALARIRKVVQALLAVERE